MSTPYVSLADLAGKIPAVFLVQALDDDADGQIDTAVWEAVQTDVQIAIDGPLSRRFATPFTAPLPPVVVAAARVLACEALYRRRGYGAKDTNPWVAPADAVRADLEKIADGSEPLSPTTRRVIAPASAVVEAAPTTDSRGRRLI